MFINRFSSGDLSSELEGEEGEGSPQQAQQQPPPQQPARSGPPSSYPVQPQAAAAGQAAATTGSTGDLSLNLRGTSRTTSAPSSPAKTRESLLQRVQSLTGAARDQSASLIGKIKISFFFMVVKRKHLTVATMSVYQ